MLEPLAPTTDDPDLVAQLGVLQNLVSPGTGDANLALAKTRTEKRFAELPELAAEHAGWFWVTAGGDPFRALEAARKNLEVGRTADAYELLAAAAEESTSEAAVCEALLGVGGLEVSSPRLDERIRQLSRGRACGAPSPSASMSPSATGSSKPSAPVSP